MKVGDPLGDTGFMVPPPASTDRHCPHTGFDKSCHEIVTECDCPLFQQTQITNDKTHEVTSFFACSLETGSLVAQTHARMVRDLGSEIEALRNVVVDTLPKAAAAAAVSALAGLAQLRGAGPQNDRGPADMKPANSGGNHG